MNRGGIRRAGLARERSTARRWIFLSNGDYESELAYLELGVQTWLYWSSSPYDAPQFPDGLMYWEREYSDD